MAVYRGCNKKMKHLFYVLFLLLGMCKLFAAEFDPSACPDLTAKIFQVNKDWAVFYVSADSYSHSGMGFKYSALQYQLFKKSGIMDATYIMDAICDALFLSVTIFVLKPLLFFLILFWTIGIDGLSGVQ